MKEDSKKFIAYYRVSTKRQGMSGLGLDAQRRDVRRMCGEGILNEYVEIETGKISFRPQLQRALSECREKGCTLIIAKLDRLSRNSHFVTGLLEAGVQFKCADMPDIDNMTITILAAVAQREVEDISMRTKKGLRSRQLKGLPCGTKNPKWWMHENNISGIKRWQKAGSASVSTMSLYNENSLKALKFIEKAYGEDHKTLVSIAYDLNRYGFQAPMGGKFSAMQVKRLWDKKDLYKNQ